MSITSTITSAFKHKARIGAFALALGAIGLSAVSGTAMAAETIKAGFVAYDATRYKENPDLTKYGMKDLLVAYEGSLWPSGASKSQPDTSYIANNYIPKIRGLNPKLLVIDIEAWKLTSSMTATEITTNITKFKKVVSVFRRELPNTKIGFYLVMPERNWLAPCGDPAKVASRTTTWHNHNLRLKPLADAVDVIVPSLYTFYEDPAKQACWATYAKANINEAKIYGKPVIPFLWMKYHTTGNWIPGSVWRQELETVYSLSNSLAIWSMASSGDAWSWTRSWWVETSKFLTAKQLTP